MSLVAFNLCSLFASAVELAEATAEFDPCEFEDLNDDADLTVQCRWHDKLDAIELAANRIKRVLGAKGPLEAADVLIDNSPVTWTEFDSQFRYADHSPVIRCAFIKLANAAIDLSGYASTLTSLYTNPRAKSDVFRRLPKSGLEQWQFSDVQKSCRRRQRA